MHLGERHPKDAAGSIHRLTNQTQIHLLQVGLQDVHERICPGALSG